jgi:hypothetical protein
MFRTVCRVTSRWMLELDSHCRPPGSARPGRTVLQTAVLGMNRAASRFGSYSNPPARDFTTNKKSRLFGYGVQGRQGFFFCFYCPSPFPPPQSICAGGFNRCNHCMHFTIIPLSRRIGDVLCIANEIVLCMRKIAKRKSLSNDCCNGWGPYHRATAAKRMQRHFLAAELLYI